MKLDAETFADLVVTAIKSAVDGPLVSGRIAELSRRIKELEDRPPAVEWAGTWTGGKSYQCGQLVSKNGLWLCLLDNTGAVPGQSTAWKLIVRKHVERDDR